MAQLSCSSSVSYRWSYDVFLSFRGEDTRLGFVGHLYDALRQRGIRAFIDDESIKGGEEIPLSLFKAIRESRIAIVVFSENYASSTFCLDELAKILECFKEEGRLVYPVFYYVDPSELRHQKGSYGEALALLENRFKDNKLKVEKWRLALSQAANLKGWHLKPKIAKEQECIAKIISEVSTRITHDRLHVTQYPVGLVSRVKEVISLLDLWCTKEVKMVGIRGAGGIGKSTIARAIYNSIADHFEGLCFLPNIREKSKMPNGLSHLQEILLSKLVMEKDNKFRDFYEGIPIIKHRLSQKRILLILDDVDEMKQLEALAGSCDWFGSGSRIIITTRNKQLLVSHDVKNLYDVRELNDKESLQLLSWHAFKKENVESNFIEVFHRAIFYSCGFPLALEVIGSNLCGKGVDEWRIALDQFERIPEERILKSLKISYNSLGQFEKKIFLDLACFFKGEKFGDVKGKLSCLHGIQPEYAIGVLINKSLIKIEGDHVTMHDLIEDMGKEIVRQESPYEPGKRSRLWFYQDILRVLKENTGTNKVEAIILDLPEGNEVQVQWSRKAFKKMTNLKMLVIKNACFSKCPKYLPNSLRWLEWKGYPFKSLPHNICSTQLIYLDLSYSYFGAELLQPFAKEFQSLSCMNFRNCKFLQQMPDLSGVPNLRELWLDDCTSLTEIHDSVGCLSKLRELSAMRCENLQILPHGLKLTSLEHLNLYGCSSLRSFPEILVEMRNIQTLDLDRTAITELPSSICNLIGLEILNIEECSNLEQLPASICMLPNLWALYANACGGMRHFKMCEAGEEASSYCYALSQKLKHFCSTNCNFSDFSLALCLPYFTSMIRLDLSFNNFTTLPACIKNCHHLRYLLLDNCKRLQHIVGMPSNLEKFSAISCISLTKSSKSKVLYQALSLQPGKRNFILPGENFPEKVNHYSRRNFMSFWVRDVFDVFPTIFLWILVKHDQDFLSNCTFMVHINDIKLDISSEWLLLSTIKTGHLCICDLQSIIHKAELSLAYKWNNVTVSLKTNTQDINSEREIHFAVHVYKQQNNLENIRFMNPYKRQKVQQSQEGKELEDDMHYQDLASGILLSLWAQQAVLASKWTYDVFVSFRGEDECSSLVSHLYNSLCLKGIRAFISGACIKSGAEFKAIQESRMAIIVFSKKYASSTYCLDELMMILECFNEECRLVYPIFYDVNPSELRHQTGSCGEAMAGLERRFKDNKQKVQKFRLALSKIANIEGWHLNPWIFKEEWHIGRIITQVSAMIGSFPLDVCDDLVGLDSRVQKVISLVDVGSKEKVKMIGICGISGIGKSSITRAVCNSIAHHFEDVWFFSSDIVHLCYKGDLSDHEEKSLYEIVRGNHTFTWNDFHNLIQQPWFQRKKILVIVDDVDELSQLQAVVVKCYRFGLGSRIIITTRNQQLLRIARIETIYDVEKLSDGEARQLLSWTAFKKDNVDFNYVDVSKHAIRCSGRLPLVLEAIGSYFGGKTVDECNSVLNKMEKYPLHMFLRKSGLFQFRKSERWNFRAVEEWLMELAFLEEKELEENMNQAFINLSAQRARLPSSWTYDVFVSFSDEDECSSFVRDIYNSLCLEGIHAFISGACIKNRAKFKAIEESRVAIIVFSKNYASSTSCQDELMKIFECFNEECRVIVYPIFYDFTSLDLKYQSGSYKEILAGIEKRFKDNKQKVQKFILALSKVANLKSSPYVHRWFFREYGEIERIIAEVSAMIGSFPLQVIDFTGEFEYRVQEVISLVDVGSNEKVEMIGICGIGGIGISPIARALCNSIAHHFEDLWFFAFEKKSLYEIVRGNRKITWCDFHDLIVRHWFRQRKILLIVDDVDELDQLRALVGRYDGFGYGSRIIITTRNKESLVSLGIERIYDVKK